MRKAKMLHLLGGTAAIWLSPAPLHAQAAPAEEVTSPATAAQAAAAETPQDGIGDIVVTAQKRSENVNKVAISINAISGSDLVSKGITSTNDLVKLVPGFTYTESTYGNPVYTLRGIGFYDTSLGAAPAVTIYVDEVPLPYSILSTAANLDLERVEVLKGPQGTLFGQNATGGAINYIAAKPTSRLAAGATLTYGRFNQLDGEAFVSGPLSDTLKIRVSARVNSRDDWQYSYTRRDRIGGGQVAMGRILLDWQPTDRLSFLFNANGFRDRSDNQASQFITSYNRRAATPLAIVNYPAAPSNNRAADWDPNTALRRHNDYWQVSLRGTYDLADAVTLTSITAYQRFTRDSLVDADGTAIQNFSIGTPGHIHSFSQELRASGTSGRVKYVVGGNFSSDQIADALRAYFTNSSNAFFGALQRSEQDVKTYAGFGNVDWTIVDRLTLQGGVRYTSQRRDFDGCYFDTGAGDLARFINAFATPRAGVPINVPPGGCVTLDRNFRPGPVSDRLSEDSVSWKGGISFEAAPRTLLYANVSKGYKNGAFPTSGASLSAQLAPVTQESVVAYEAGFKFGTDDRRLQLNGAAFYYDYRNKQLRGRVIDPAQGPVNALVNVPRSDIVGGELQLTWLPMRGLTLTGGATYIKSRIRDDFTNYNYAGQLQNFGGQTFPLTPKWQLSGDAQYEPRLNDNLTGVIGVSATYQSRAFAQLGEIPLLRIDAYAIADFRLGVRTADSRWSATAFVRNAFDKYYWTFVPAGLETITRLAGTPRTYGVTIGWRY